jgi:hypothetical protein
MSIRDAIVRAILSGKAGARIIPPAEITEVVRPGPARPLMRQDNWEAKMAPDLAMEQALRTQGVNRPDYFDPIRELAKKRIEGEVP